MEPKFNMHDHVYIEAKIIGTTTYKFGNTYNLEICTVSPIGSFQRKVISSVTEEDIHKVF